MSGFPVSALAGSITTSTALAARFAGSNRTFAENVLNRPLLGTSIWRPVKVMRLWAGSTVHSGASAAATRSAAPMLTATATKTMPLVALRLRLFAILAPSFSSFAEENPTKSPTPGQRFRFNLIGAGSRPRQHAPQHVVTKDEVMIERRQRMNAHQQQQRHRQRQVQRLHRFA